MNRWHWHDFGLDGVMIARYFHTHGMGEEPHDHPDLEALEGQLLAEELASIYDRPKKRLRRD